MNDLLAQLAALPPGERDAALERQLGIEHSGELSTSPGPELIGYHASGLTPVLTALLEARPDEHDVFVDLGSGLGKVTALARLTTTARVRGIELQERLIARSVKLEGIEYLHGDLRTAPLDDGTIFFLYNPVTGAVLEQLISRLRAVAEHHAIVVCALGVPLRPQPWLRPRTLDHFWLQVFDSEVPGVPARRREMTEESAAKMASICSLL